MVHILLMNQTYLVDCFVGSWKFPCVNPWSWHAGEISPPIGPGGVGGGTSR